MIFDNITHPMIKIGKHGGMCSCGSARFSDIFVTNAIYAKMAHSLWPM